MNKKGIDASSWQMGIDLSSVKKAGYDFVIIRAGFTGYGADRIKQKDSCFEKFYTEAKRNKLGVGCYWYSCATSKTEGIREAEYLYKNCLKGKQFDYPIYIDVEESRWQAHSKIGVTDAIIGFCEYLEDKGFYAGVYASLSWFNTKIDTTRLKAYTKWIANWTAIAPKVNFSGFDMWQNSDDGRAGGKNIDTDIAFKDFPQIIKEGGFNGYPKTVTDGGKTQTPEKAKKTISQIAQEVLQGKWGNGIERQTRLTNAGYNYDKVQKKVNELLSGHEEVTYTVKAGDTLSSIAKKYKTTVRAIAKKNKIKDANKIYTGQRLRIDV